MLSLLGAFLVFEIMADQNPQAPQAVNLQQIENLLQAIVTEQTEQRNQINALGQAVQVSGQAVQGTQQATEQIVTQVVQQVEQTFQQGNQNHQDQLNQLAQNFQTEQQAQQQQIQMIAQAIQGLQTQNVTNSTGVSGQHGGGTTSPTVPGSPPHPPPGGSQAGTPLHPGAGGGVQTGGAVTNAATGSGGQGGPSQIPPFPGMANPGVNGPTPQAYNIGGNSGVGGASTSVLSPAVAYAMQQGGVDGRALGKPSTYDPLTSKGSFTDWSDHVITTCDSSMPGVYEIMEWIVNTQPRTPLTAGNLKLGFPHIDPLLIDYAESNVFAIISTYTAGEARSLVRQAKRPHGMEAWRLLQMRFNPVTVGRQRAHLVRITNPTEGVALDKLGAEVVAWENRIADYESRPGADIISESVRMAALIHMCPSRLREHLQLNAERYNNYTDLRREVFSYLDHVLPVTSTAMDVGALGVQGCWESGSTQHYARDCPGKGKHGKNKGKGKSSGKDAYKGKGGKDAGGKKGGKGKGKAKGKSKDGKGHKGAKGQEHKPLNSISPDPRLGQIQSAYAKAAMEAYQRERNVAVAAPMVLAPPSPPAASCSPSASSSGQAAWWLDGEESFCYESIRCCPSFHCNNLPDGT